MTIVMSEITAIIPAEKESTGVEILNIGGIECYEKDGVAYLNLESVARGLGFTKTDVKFSETGFRKEYIRVDWPRVRQYLEDFGVAQKCTTGDFIPENIFYRLAMKAKNAAAERFQAKVADEIIPSIRKHGAYMTPETLEKAILSPDYLLKVVTALKEETDKRKALEDTVKEQQPKVVFADAVSTAKTSILVGELAKILKQNGVNVGQNRLFEWMRQNGYLIKCNGVDFNMPTQRSMEMGLFEIKETAVARSDGSVAINKTPKVSGRGQVFFVNKILKEGID